MENYLKQARKDFTKVAAQYSVKDHLVLRTAIDSFLIAYDQAMDNTTSNMPRSLTAENGAKALLIGEFKESYGIYNEEEGYHHTEEVDVEWSTIKEIYNKIVEHYER